MTLCVKVGWPFRRGLAGIVCVVWCFCQQSACADKLKDDAAASPLPSVIGLRSATAIQVLRLTGFEPQVGVYHIAPQNWRDDLKPDVVYLQAPRAGAKYEGMTIGLWTFRKGRPGQRPVSVPKITDLGAEDALNRLHEVGLTPMSDTKKSWRKNRFSRS